MRKNVIDHEAILECAAEIIKESNIDALTMRNLSNKANIAVGTLYNYFPSQEALLTEVFTYSWSVTFDKLRKQVDTSKTLRENNLMFFEILSIEIEARKGLGEVLMNTSVLTTTNHPLTKLVDIYSELVSSFIQINKERAEIVASMVLVGFFKVYHDSSVTFEEYFDQYIVSLLDS